MEKNKLETKVKGKKPFYKTWWFILIVVIVIAGMFGSNEEEAKATEPKTEVMNTDTNKIEVKQQPVVKEEIKETVKSVRVTKNEENGDYVLQMVIPENSTEKEILDFLMDTAVANKKSYQGDNITVVAYGNEEYMYKSLLGTHGRIRLVNGGTDYIKISPKGNITEEDKNDFKEYFNWYEALRNSGDSVEKSKKEARAVIKARNKENYKEIIEKAEKYFFDIDNVKNYGG